MKVKIIVESHTQDLEHSINEFIKNKYVYDIKVTLIGGAVVMATILYDEELKEPMAVQHVKGE